MLGCGKSWALVVLMLGSVNWAVRADDSIIARQFGAGVHDFYQGRYFEAIEHFDQAVGADGRDARVYFFRGLAKQRLGWTDEARTDFLLGSQLEVALKRRDVGTALQRVQGPDRLILERYRREARALPEAMVRNVVPQSRASIVQRPEPRQQPEPRPRARAATRHFAAANIPADASDPFREGAPGLLGRGDIEAAPDQVATDAQQAAPAKASAEHAVDLGRGQPFGSGVVAEAESDADVQDPFGMDNAAGTTNPPAESAKSGAGAAGGGGVLGAAWRALSRTMVPTSPPRANADPFAEPAAETDSSAATDDRAAADDDPFAEPASGDPTTGGANQTTDPQQVDDADPFVDAPTGQADPSTDPQQAPADDNADPFVDEDPFKF
jgi:hypothetical protein